jgi:integrase
MSLASAFGAPLKGNHLRERSFARLCARAGLGHLRFHSLRHSAATLLLSSGINPKMTSEMLGHSDVATTLRTYSHVLEPMQDAAADAMDAIFKASP